MFRLLLQLLLADLSVLLAQTELTAQLALPVQPARVSQVQQEQLARLALLLELRAQLVRQESLAVLGLQEAQEFLVTQAQLVIQVLLD
jgi:hypothetical protein